jgi:hypothetical protein
MRTRSLRYGAFALATLALASVSFMTATADTAQNRGQLGQRTGSPKWQQEQRYVGVQNGKTADFDFHTTTGQSAWVTATPAKSHYHVGTPKSQQ